MSGGTISVYWHSDYNGTGVTYGNFDAQKNYHKITYTSVSATRNESKIESPHIDAVKLEFDNPFQIFAGYSYLLSTAGFGFKFGFNVGGSMSMYDQYNNLVWTYDSYSPGSTQYSQNGFLYFLLNDSPSSIGVKTIFFRFNTSYSYDGSLFNSLGVKGPSYLQIVRLQKDGSADSVIEAIENQTNAEQGRYDEFTSSGDSQGSELISGAEDAVSDKIGILDFAEGVLSDFVQLFSADPGDATLTLPGFKWHDAETGENLTVWDAQTFDFAFIEEHFGPLVSALRVGTVLAVYGAMLWYLQGVFERIFGGGGADD